MRFAAALASGVTVYLAIGYLTGYAPDLRLRARDKPQLSSRQLWLIQAGSDLTPRQFWAGSILVGFLSFLMALVVTGAWWLAMAPAIGAALFPARLLRSAATGSTR